MQVRLNARGANIAATDMYDCTYNTFRAQMSQINVNNKNYQDKNKKYPNSTSIGLHIKYMQYMFVLPYFNIYILHFTIHISPPTGSGPLILLTMPECWFVSILIVVCFKFKYKVVTIVAVPITVMEEQTSKSQNLILTVFRKL